MDWYFPYDFYDPDGVRLDIIDQIVNNILLEADETVTEFPDAAFRG